MTDGLRSQERDERVIAHVINAEPPLVSARSAQPISQGGDAKPRNFTFEWALAYQGESAFLASQGWQETSTTGNPIHLGKDESDKTRYEYSL